VDRQFGYLLIRHLLPRVSRDMRFDRYFSGVELLSYRHPYNLWLGEKIPETGR
jgi:hypothetical protein